MKKDKPIAPTPTEPAHEPSRAEWQAAMVAEFYAVLTKSGIPPAHACELTRAWIATWKATTKLTGD